jgi:hypothetical protein
MPTHTSRKSAYTLVNPGVAVKLAAQLRSWAPGGGEGVPELLICSLDEKQRWYACSAAIAQHWRSPSTTRSTTVKHLPGNDALSLHGPTRVAAHPGDLAGVVRPPGYRRGSAGSETCLRVSPIRVSLPLLTAKSPRDTMPTSRFARLRIGRRRIWYRSIIWTASSTV